MAVIENYPTNEFRWIARIIASIVIIFFLVLTIGLNLTGCTGDETTKESIIFILMFGVAIVGTIIAWFWEKIGGIFLIIAGFSIGTYLLILRGTDGIKVAMIFGLPVLISGLIFFIYSISKNRKTKGL